MTGTVQITDEQRIRELIDHHVRAMGTGDAQAVAAIYGPDAVSFDLRPPLLWSSPTAERATELRSWFAGFVGPVEITVRDLTVAVAGDVAFCHSVNSLSATPLGSPESFTLWFRSTLGLRKSGDGWTIVHEHKSVPFYMEMDESYHFRAATDLQP